VLRETGETETMQDWLKLDERDHGSQLPTEKEIATLIILFVYFTNTTYIIKFSIYLFSKFFVL
jgi:hypothetical protein